MALEVRLGLGRIVARDDRDVGNFLEGVTAGLARLQLHKVKQVGLVRKNEVMEAPQDGLLGGEGHEGPRLLGRAGRVHGALDIRDSRQGKVRDGRTGHRGDDGERLGVGSADDLLGKAPHDLGVNRVRRGRRLCRAEDLPHGPSEDLRKGRHRLITATVESSAEKCSWG